MKKMIILISICMVGHLGSFCFAKEPKTRKIASASDLEGRWEGARAVGKRTKRVEFRFFTHASKIVGFEIDTGGSKATSAVHGYIHEDTGKAMITNVDFRPGNRIEFELSKDKSRLIGKYYTHGKYVTDRDAHEHSYDLSRIK